MLRGLKERVRDCLKRKAGLHALWIYTHQIRRGFRKYLDLKKRYGKNAAIFDCVLHGTGDIYFVTQYLRAYMEREGIDNYVFLLGGPAEINAAKLFPDLFFEGRYEIVAENELCDLMFFRLFIGCPNVDIHHLHHWCYTSQLNVTNGLEGYRDLSMADFYLCSRLRLERSQKKDRPQFSEDRTWTEDFFRRNNLQAGKTVLLSPYSISAGRLDMRFWEKLANALLKNGYSVCTNGGGGNEPAIKGTVPVFFRFADAKIFLEHAGYFVAYRSGLCDIIAELNCKKIIIYPKNVVYCLPGRAISYVGLKAMGLCEDALELEYGSETLSKILEEFGMNNQDSASGFQAAIEPAFKDSTIAVGCAVSEEYLPYLNVTIQSMIDRSTEDNNYDIVVLYERISIEDKKKTRSLIEERNNFSIRFIDVGEWLKQYADTLPTDERWGPIIYARLILPDLMRNYERVVYIDADTILMEDIAKLHNYDFNGNLLCAVRDTGMLAWYHMPGNPEKRYIDEVLKLKRPDDYFNSGVIVFNIPLFREQFSTKFLFEYAASRDWKWKDQDVFMTLCDGRIGLVEQKWNVLVSWFRDEVDLLEDAALRLLKEEYLEALKEPKLVHFLGTGFLSLSPAPAWSELFWTFAKKTKFYDELMKRAIEFTTHNSFVPSCESNARNYEDVVLKRFLQGQVGFRYIVKYFKAWLGYKIMKR